MSTRTHIIEIEVEDNDDVKTASDLASLAAGAAEFVQNALPDSLDVTAVRTSTNVYGELGVGVALGGTFTSETAEVPFDPAIEERQIVARDNAAGED